MKRKINGSFIFNTIVGILIVLIFLYLCLSEDGLSELLQNIKEFKKTWLLTAVICHLLNVSIDVVLIYKFTKQNHKEYKFKDAIKTSMIGMFFSAVTPSSTGGQPMQIYAMSKQGVDVGTSTSALVQKFLVYQTVLIFYGVLAVITRFEYLFSLESFIWGFTMIGFLAQALTILAILLFSFNRNFTHKIIVLIFKFLYKIKIIKNYEERISNIENNLELFHGGNTDLYKNPKLLIEVYVLTFFQLIFVFIIPYCIYRSFGLAASGVINMLCAQIFINMISWIVPLPGASGGAEVASAVYLSPFFDKTMIKPAIVMTRFISYYFTIIISAPFSRLVKKKCSKTGKNT